MPLDLRAVKRRIEQSVARVSLEFYRDPDSILTEQDLRCRLDRYLSPSVLYQFGRNGYRRIVHGRVYHELSWFDENRRLRFIPDITILDPDRLRTRFTEHDGIIDPYCGNGANCWSGTYRSATRLPSKGCEFDGAASFIELKVVRNGITQSSAKLIKKDLQKMTRLLRILQERGDEETFGYLIIFNPLQQPPWETSLAKFLVENKNGPNHKIMYTYWHPLSSLRFFTSDNLSRSETFGDLKGSARKRKKKFFKEGQSVLF